MLTLAESSHTTSPPSTHFIEWIRIELKNKMTKVADELKTGKFVAGPADEEGSEEDFEPDHDPHHDDLQVD